TSTPTALPTSRGRWAAPASTRATASSTWWPRPRRCAERHRITTDRPAGSHPLPAGRVVVRAVEGQPAAAVLRPSSLSTCPAISSGVDALATGDVVLQDRGRGRRVLVGGDRG